MGEKRCEEEKRGRGSEPLDRERYCAVSRNAVLCMGCFYVCALFVCCCICLALPVFRDELNLSKVCICVCVCDVLRCIRPVFGHVNCLF